MLPTYNELPHFFLSTSPNKPPYPLNSHQRLCVLSIGKFIMTLLAFCFLSSEKQNCQTFIKQLKS